MPLTDTKIRNAKPGSKPFKLPDGNGLSLEVRSTGSKLWRYRYRIDGKENVFAIGAYFNDKRAGHLSLDQARRCREEARELVKRGIHPAHHRKEARFAQRAGATNTFEAVARDWLEQKRASWTHRYSCQVERWLEFDVFPYIGRLPIRSVTAAHLLEIMRRVEARGSDTVALSIRQCCSSVYRYAVATLRAEFDPASALKGAITPPRTKHRKPLSRAEIVRFTKALGSYGGHPSTIIALRLMLLTFVRTIELRNAEWSEIDLSRAEWRIPAERMKMRDAHVVPLSKQAIDLLRELHMLTGGQRLLFPNDRRPTSCMSDTRLARALERMGVSGRGSTGFSPHGFRATASTILNEAGCRPDVIERQLAHKERNRVRAAYNQAEYLNERRAMMQLWADMIDGMLHNAEGGQDRERTLIEELSS